MSDTTHPDPTLVGSPDDAPLAPSLVVLEDERSWRFPLPVAGEVVIGRAPECAVALADPTASRSHARLRLDEGRLYAIDLGSYNGTLVNGERLAGERELRDGDLIQICHAALLVHGLARRATAGPVLDDAGVHHRLAVELDRARRYQRAVAILAARFDDRGARDRALVAIQARLRPLDAVGSDGATGALVIVPEVAAAEVAAELADLAGALAGARAGWASFPADALDGAALIASARAAAAAAPPGAIVGADHGVRRIDLGGHAIVLAEPAMLRAFALLERLAVGALPILVLGETGVGKESAATAVHHYSRRPGPLLTINCAAIPEHLVESELFGHERGAFSGAVAARAGLFEAAKGGTVFLDEIGELPAAVQAKLLRALDGHAITRVGSVTPRPIDVRVVAATHRDLKAMAQGGRFRDDLYYRLGGATVTIPPLRERPRELPLLVRELLARARARLGREPAELTGAALHALARHAWPGNIRELRNAIDYAAAAADGDLVDSWHLPPTIVGDLDAAPAPAVLDSRASRGGSGPRAPAAFRPIAEEVRELERRRMQQALVTAGGVQTRAAELLQMPRRTFVAKLREYGLTEPRRR